jgi:hypothetical protein
MTVAFNPRKFMSTERARNEWRKFYCNNPECRAHLGWTNSVAAIVGGLFIQQPQVRVLCRNAKAGCQRVKVVSLATARRMIRYLSEQETMKILGSNRD